MTANKILIGLVLGALLLLGIFAGTSQSVAGAVPGDIAQGGSGRPPTTSEIEFLTLKALAPTSVGLVEQSPVGSAPTVGELPAMLAAETLLLNGSISFVNLPVVVK